MEHGRAAAILGGVSPDWGVRGALEATRHVSSATQLRHRTRGHRSSQIGISNPRFTDIRVKPEANVRQRARGFRTTGLVMADPIWGWSIIK